MPPMTQAQGRANWAGNPSLSQLWLGSTLHILAMLVSTVARLFRFQQPNPTAECDGSPAQTPEADTVLDQLQEATTTAVAVAVAVAGIARAAARGATIEGLMVSRELALSARSRPSNHEDGLHNSLNESSSALCRGSRFEERWNSQDSHRRTNQDSRDALRLPENDPLLDLWMNLAALRVSAHHTAPA
jgi:hypothetical protein